MKIVYFAHLKNNTHRENDEDVAYALKKLGHTVVKVDDRTFTMNEIVKKTADADLFLFHKGGVNEETEETHRLTLERLGVLLELIRSKNPKCKIAFWYVDKVYMGREEWIQKVLPLVDAGFLTDETFIRRHNYANLYPLKQGAPDKPFKGKKNPVYECDIAYIGSIYAKPREMFVNSLNKEYGDKFRVYNNVFDKDFADLCKSAKIIVSPDFPLDDFYWGDRIYRVLGCGGFMVHPRLQGLTDSGIINNSHYVGFYDWNELKGVIDSFLLKKNDKIRKKIAAQGHDVIMKDHTLSKRLEELLSKLQ